MQKGEFSKVFELLQAIKKNTVYQRDTTSKYWGDPHLKKRMTAATQNIDEVVTILKEKEREIEQLKYGGEQFMVFLKGQGFEENTRIILEKQGIGSLGELRGFSKEEFIAAGIKMKDAAELVKL